MARALMTRGFEVELFHRQNSVPEWLQSPRSKLARYILDVAVGYYAGRNASSRIREDVVAVISNGPVGWYPLTWSHGSVKRIHFYHGTYWGVAEAVRPLIRHRGYLKYKWWDAMLLERLSGRGKICLSNSQQSTDEIQRLFGYSCRTVWVPVDTATFRPLDKLSCRAQLGLPQDQAIGVFAGSLEPHKGFSLVRALIAESRNLHWLLLMRGSLPRDLETKTNVSMLSNLSDKQVALVYNAADFLICPSRYEPFGYVVAEALACGTPAVAAPCGASRLLLREPSMSHLVIDNPESAREFSRAISQVLSDPDGYRQAVLLKVRPVIENLLSPEAWCNRFLEAIGI